MKLGDTCWIVISNYCVQEVKIIKISGNLYTLKFSNECKAIRLLEHRLFKTESEAKMSIGIDDTINEKTGLNRPPKPPQLH